MDDSGRPGLDLLRGIAAHLRSNWAKVERANPPGTPQYALNAKLLANIEHVIRLKADIEAAERSGDRTSQEQLEDLQRRLSEVSHDLQNVIAFASELEGDSFIKPAGLDQLP